MSGPRKLVEGVRAIGMMVGAPLILMLSAFASVRSTLRALAEGACPRFRRSSARAP
ncbi:MAG TPA: hypothetical protein VKO62_04335 [Solirubrobacterales bacterium]|nr:hypothetical protein [Solirubrobacterales bacterium]